MHNKWKNYSAINQVRKQDFPRWKNGLLYEEFWWFVWFFLMTWGYIHPTYFLFSIANSCGKCSAHSMEWRFHFSSIPMSGSGTRLTQVKQLKVKQLLFSKIRKIIRRNPSKITKKSSGFKHGIRQNANRFCALCELHQKKSFKQFPSSLQAQTQNRWKSPLQFNSPWIRES